MIAGVEIENRSCDPDHALLGVICHTKARIWYTYLYADEQTDFRQGRGKKSNHESQNTDEQGTWAPATTLYVLCALQESTRLDLPW